MKTTLIKALKPVLMIMFMLLLTKVGFSQDPGDNPDGPPPAVPFEDYMHLILIVAGGILAMVTIRGLQKKHA